MASQWLELTQMKAGGSLASETYASLLGMETDAQRFREEAEECRKLACRAINPLDKEAWLKLAAEDQAGPRSGPQTPILDTQKPRTTSGSHWPSPYVR
jgi:hypothetical protein